MAEGGHGGQSVHLGVQAATVSAKDKEHYRCVLVGKMKSTHMQTFFKVPFPPFFVLSRQYAHLLQSFLLQFSHVLQAMVLLLVLNCRSLNDPVVGRATREKGR